MISVKTPSSRKPETSRVSIQPILLYTTILLALSLLAGHWTGVDDLHAFSVQSAPFRRFLLRNYEFTEADNEKVEVCQTNLYDNIRPETF